MAAPVANSPDAFLDTIKASGNHHGDAASTITPDNWVDAIVCTEIDPVIKIILSQRSATELRVIKGGLVLP
jgi:hypothetical protein